MIDEKDKRIKELEEEKKCIEDEKKCIEDEKKCIEDEKKCIEKDLEDTRKEFEDTKKEFEEFKAKHAGTVQNLQKALKIKPDLPKSKNKIGAKEKHKGHGRESPTTFDKEEPLIPDVCPDCNTSLEGKTVSIRTRFVTTIRIISPAKICEYFRTIHDIHISVGEIPHILTQLAREYGDYYAHLQKLVRAARVKHTDSTSWRIKGKNHTAWVFIAAGVVLYKIRKSPSHKTPLEVLGKAIKGMTLVVDRHSAFRTLAKKAGYVLQLCWSHILEDSRELKHSFGTEGKYVHQNLKRIFALAKSFNHQATPQQVSQLKEEILKLTKRRYKHITVGRFVKNLAHRDIEDLFRFTTDPEIDPTNNISERELRHLVMIRKLSNGSRTQRGANVTAQLTSIIQTLKLRKENVLQGLINLNTTQLQTTE